MSGVRIVVFRTCIKVFGYIQGSQTDLETFFQVPDKLDPAAGTYKAIMYDEENHILTLPRGMDISSLERLFETECEYSPNVDPYDTNIPFRLSYKPRDDVQREAIQFILGEGMHQETKPYSQLGVNLNTGAGKTYVTICCSAMMGMRSIMITSSLGWIEQWRDRIMEYTDCSPTEIYPIVGSGSIAMILNNMVNISKVKYFLASHQTLHSYASNYGWDKVGDLFEKIRVGIKIYDEAHLDFDNIWKIDFFTNTYKTLYLTATPFRSDREEDRIYQETFLNVPKIDLFDKDRDPRTRYISVLYNTYPTPGQERYCTNRYGFDRNRYCSYLIKNEQFYKILTIAMEMIFRTGKTLIYIGTNRAIQTVYDWIIENYPELKDQVGIYTTLITNKIEKEQQLDKMIILSTTKSCGAAIDIKGLKMTMVLGEVFKSKVIARQSLGRTRDKDTTYIDFVDVGFDAVKGCYKAKKEIFEKYATSMTEEVFSNSKFNYTTRTWDKDDTILNENYYEALQSKANRRFTSKSNAVCMELPIPEPKKKKKSK